MHAGWGGRHGTVTTVCDQLAGDRERQALTLARHPGTQTHHAVHGFSVRTGCGAAVLGPTPSWPCISLAGGHCHTRAALVGGHLGQCCACHLALSLAGLWCLRPLVP